MRSYLCQGVKNIEVAYCLLLNLPTLATPEQLAAELDKLKAVIAAPATQAMRQQLALGESAGLGELLTAAHARLGQSPDPAQYVPRAEFERVSHALNALQKAGEDARVEAAVKAAVSAGKVAPVSAEWAHNYCRSDPNGFAAFVASVPVLIPGAQTASHTATKPPEAQSENPLLADAKRRQAAGK